MTFACVDASALVKLVVPDAESPRLLGWCDDRLAAAARAVGLPVVRPA